MSRHEVKLVYPGFKLRDPAKGRAVGKARITKAQIIVEEGEVTEGTVRLRLPLRFRRDDLLPIPWLSSLQGWRLDAELGRSWET